MPARPQPINLMPASEFEDSFGGKFLHWAVTSGRYIIILTEILVIAAFLSRFKLDQDLADINQTIEQQKALLIRQKPIEEEFRFTQSRFETIEGMMGQQVQTREKFERLLASLPESIKLAEVRFEKNEVEIQGVTLSETAIGQFLVKLKQDSYWRELEMTDFLTKDGAEINFTLIMRT